MTKSNGVEIVAPSDDPATWLVGIPSGGAMIHFGWGSSGPMYRSRMGTFVSEFAMEIAREDAKKEFAELFRLRGKDIADRAACGELIETE